ncbi:MAG: 50S ribosome-binding GTPase [Aphanizomenon flos-aquae Clear-A1]|nr:50S ribosome-binding GTPase [Aphanizomenon flos-aquae Clear-A1]
MKIDTEAIARHLNQSLTLNGIIGVTAKVSVNHDCLKIVLESVAVTKKDQDQLLAIIKREIAYLNLTSIKTVKVCRKRIDSFEPNWYHKYDLKVSQAEFEDALKQCSKTANSAYNLSIRYAKKIEIVIIQLNSDIEAVSHEILKLKGSEQFQFTETLKQIQFDVKNISEDSLEYLVISLDKKRKHLKDFTVALFGRTKAGKSTLRETLTRGNGSTIGKGSQRTTRDVTEYSWQGLRLLDTPGIEAYKGEDDTQKANEIIDQSDIILYLTSDDSVQPGEFKPMAQLQQINKYFAVILNVKYDISNKLEDLKMVLDNPEIIFDEDRLSQHKNHIQSQTQADLNLDNVDIVTIHAQAGFLSTKEEYQEYSSQLWELSKIEELYSLIAYQIDANGRDLRLSTFADSLEYFIDLINQKLTIHKSLLSVELEFKKQKQGKIEEIFTDIKKDSNVKIKSECESLYNLIFNEISKFVEDNSEMDINRKQQEWQKILNQNNIHERMKDVINEIFKEFDEKLQEFQREYEYDLNNIKIDMENFKFRDIRKGRSASDMNWTSVGIGAVGAALFVAANWWNPGGWIVAAGWIATGVGIATKVAAQVQETEEKQTKTKNTEEEKDSLRKQVNEKKQATIKAYEDCLYININKSEHQLIEPLNLYNRKLSEIFGKLDQATAEILKIKLQAKQDFDNLK